MNLLPDRFKQGTLASGKSDAAALLMHLDRYKVLGGRQLSAPDVFPADQVSGSRL